jgi:hypothetical protein
VKFVDLQGEKGSERTLIFSTPWIRLALSFGKKPVDMRNWFEVQMDAIRDGKRPHPAMMTVMERHQETAKLARKFKWSNWLTDPWGTRAAIEAIACRPHLNGAAVEFLSVLTREEQAEVRRFIREEIGRAVKETENRPGEAT